MELTKEAAKKLCILKWKHIVDSNGYEGEELLDKYPIMDTLKNQCGYCELYVDPDNDCIGCPLSITNNISNKRITCFNEAHPFQYWVEFRTKESAQAVLDLIIKNE